MVYKIFDIETNGLRPNKIHCLSACVFNTESDSVDIRTTYDYEDMLKFFNSGGTFVGHNIIMYDIPVAEKILGFKFTGEAVCTLALSWYLSEGRASHGLESYGKDFGILKPEVEDWEGLTQEDYKHRCEEDVKINVELFKQQLGKLNILYADRGDLNKAVKYLSMVMKVHRNVYENPFKLDVKAAEVLLAKMEEEKEGKVLELKSAMPPNKKMGKKSKPSKMYKVNGDLTTLGLKWVKLLEENGLPIDYEGEVEYLQSEEEPNPNSTTQIKDWLYSLGWIPETFKFVREGRDFRKIEQVRVDKHGVKMLCESVKALYDVEPKLELLEGLSVLTHRISVVKGFLDSHHNGYISSEIVALTNTLRVRHKTIVNVPSVQKEYGLEIRSLLTCDDGYQVVGSDLNSLENMVALHYAKVFDEKYVENILKPNYDAHIEMAVFGNMITKEDAKFYLENKGNHDLSEEDKQRFDALTSIRSDAKTTNYAAQYGVKEKTLSRTLKKSEEYASMLLDSYWRLHRPLQQIGEACKVKTVDGNMWLWNPMAELWINLRNEKDRLNTLIQSSGSIITYTWAYLSIQQGLNLSLVYHDEVALITKSTKDIVEGKLRNAIGTVNRAFDLRPEMGIDVNIGDTYASVH